MATTRLLETPRVIQSGSRKMAAATGIERHMQPSSSCGHPAHCEADAAQTQKPLYCRKYWPPPALQLGNRHGQTEGHCALPPCSQLTLHGPGGKEGDPQPQPPSSELPRKGNTALRRGRREEGSGSKMATMDRPSLGAPALCTMV